MIFDSLNKRLKKIGKLRRKLVLFSLMILFVLLLQLLWYASLRYEDVLIKDQNMRNTGRMVIYGNALTTAINKRFALLEGLYAFTTVNTSHEILKKSFNIFASGLYLSTTGIRNFALAPGGVQRYVYPIRGNEATLGHDLINDSRPNVRIDVQRAINTRKTVLSDPYKLRQGGLGLVARRALYVNDTFWGLVTMVVDMPPIFEEAGLYSKPDDIEMALRDRSGNTIFGNGSVFENEPVILRIELPEGYWKLGCIPMGGWHKAAGKRLLVFQVSGLIVLILIVIIIYLFINHYLLLVEKNEHLKLSHQKLEQEVTERKQVKEALQENESRMRAITDSAQDAILMMDPEGRISYWNPAAERIFGYTSSEAIGQNLHQLIVPSHYHEAHHAAFPVFQQKGQGAAIGKMLDLEAIRKDGKEIPVQLSLAAVHMKGAWHAVGIIRDITEQKQAEEKIQQMAYHDSLTGLPNRQLFSDRLGIALTHAQRNKKEVGIAMLDLDNFKDVNDTLGHDVGDLLLKATAERLSAALRKGDTVARSGGDEFALILPDLKAVEDAIQVARKIVDSFREPFLIDTHQLVVTTSIGIAVYPNDGTDEGVLLKNADIAMYQAKQAGRDRYQLYNKA